ncbi:P-loop containing nucleoside triphosphate hydrolase protein [Fomes fomentarius]|nr:P-loop containing nucleoside triphosphate hydrolase protein [Fomes fomentarius]
MSQRPAKSFNSRKISALSSQPCTGTKTRGDAPPPAKKRKTKPLMSIAKLPTFDLTGIEPTSSVQDKGVKDKGKGKERLSSQVVEIDESNHCLWVDKYEPNSEEELAVHKRKVLDVRQWLFEAFEGGPSGKLKKYRRVLVLTGPAGTAKTATVRVLSRELGFEIVEWRNTMDDHAPRTENSWDHSEHESLSDKFQAFLTRAATCRPVLVAPAPTSQSSQSTQNSHVSQSTAVSTSGRQSSRRQVILLEDLPNILHSSTQVSFHAALEAFVAASDTTLAPLVLVISDVGLRGEAADGDGPRWKSRDKEAMDVRNVLPPSLLNSPYVTQIGFNPIAVTYMRTALKTVLDRHFASTSTHAGARPTKEVLDIIIESSNGDIRSAIMALQFACTAEQGKPLKGTKRGAKPHGPSAAVMLESVTRREQSLALFHLLGKIMYNKRKDDPPTSSASAKDLRRDKELDAGLKDPPPLPAHFEQHERRASRVDVEMLYADTPIDASLLSLYIHQNYTQYCNTLDECEALMESLSWVDSSGGEMWYQANPHQFHLVTLGTLHALPSPVPRRNQKPYKPAFFDNLRRKHDAEDGVRDIQMWLQQLGHMPLSGWSPEDVALGVGTVLRVGEDTGRFAERIPPTHRLFSKFEFARNTGSSAELVEDGDGFLDAQGTAPEERMRIRGPPPTEDDMPTGVALSDDDIEDW